MIRLLRDAVSAFTVLVTAHALGLLRRRPARSHTDCIDDATAVTLLLATAAAPDLTVDELDASIPHLRELGDAVAAALHRAGAR